MNVIFDNPIAWAHYRVRGGWKNHLWSTAGYVLLITAVIGVTYRLSTGSGASVLAGWTMAILGLQAAILGLYGSSVVGNAIRRDVSAGLLESHRLMPIGAGTAVAGYLLGPTFQAISMAVANLIIGAMLTSASQIPVEHWVVSNFVVVSFVVFLWVCFAYASFVAKNAFTAMFGLMFGGFGSGGILLNVMPALAVLMTPLSGRTAFNFAFRGTAMTPAYGLGLAAQIVIGGIFFCGAMRRFRRDDVPALGTVLGLMLLAAWVATSAVGIRNWELVSPVMFQRLNQPDFNVQAIGSIVAALLIALVPVAGSARMAVQWHRIAATAGGRAVHRPAPPPLVALLATVIVPAVLFGATRDREWRPAVVPVVVVSGAFLFTSSYLLRYFYLRNLRAAVWMAFWLIVTWLLPLGADALRNNFSDDLNPKPLFSLLSPIGALINVWDDNRSDAWFGLAVQGVLAVAAGVIFYSAARQGEGRAVADPAAIA